jgi:hypothetical protein
MVVREVGVDPGHDFRHVRERIGAAGDDLAEQILEASIEDHRLRFGLAITVKALWPRVDCDNSFGVEVPTQLIDLYRQTVPDDLRPFRLFELDKGKSTAIGNVVTTESETSCPKSDSGIGTQTFKLLQPYGGVTTAERSTWYVTGFVRRA